MILDLRFNAVKIIFLKLNFEQGLTIFDFRSRKLHERGFINPPYTNLVIKWLKIL